MGTTAGASLSSTLLILFAITAPAVIAGNAPASSSSQTLPPGGRAAAAAGAANSAWLAMLGADFERVRVLLPTLEYRAAAAAPARGQSPPRPRPSLLTQRARNRASSTARAAGRRSTRALHQLASRREHRAGLHQLLRIASGHCSSLLARLRPDPGSQHEMGMLQGPFAATDCNAAAPTASRRAEDW